MRIAKSASLVAGLLLPLPVDAQDAPIEYCLAGAEANPVGGMALDPALSLSTW